MKNNKVKVIKETLGLKVGDILVFDETSKNYVFENTDIFSKALESLNVETHTKVTFSKNIVEDNINIYFEYLKPEPKVKTISEIETMIKEHQTVYNQTYEKLYGNTDWEENDTRRGLREKLTVHWNIIKMLEWALGY